jgi:hypothetical protein
MSDLVSNERLFVALEFNRRSLLAELGAIGAPKDQIDWLAVQGDDVFEHLASWTGTHVYGSGESVRYALNANLHGSFQAAVAERAPTSPTLPSRSPCAPNLSRKEVDELRLHGVDVRHDDDLYGIPLVSIMDESDGMEWLEQAVAAGHVPYINGVEQALRAILILYRDEDAPVKKETAEACRRLVDIALDGIFTLTAYTG